MYSNHSHDKPAQASPRLVVGFVEFHELGADHLFLEHSPEDFGFEYKVLKGGLHMRLGIVETIGCCGAQLRIFIQLFYQPERRSTLNLLLRILHRHFHSPILLLLLTNLTHLPIPLTLNQQQLQPSHRSLQITPSLVPPPRHTPGHPLPQSLPIPIPPTTLPRPIPHFSIPQFHGDMAIMADGPG